MHLWDRFMGGTAAAPRDIRDEEQIIPDVAATEDKIQRDLNQMNAEAAFDPYGYGLDGEPIGLPTWVTWALIGLMVAIGVAVVALPH